jgi:arylsulfatase
VQHQILVVGSGAGVDEERLVEIGRSGGVEGAERPRRAIDVLAAGTAASRLIGRRTFRITVDWNYRPGDHGILVAHGGQEGGYVLWVEDDQLGLTINAFGTPLPIGLAPIPSESERIDVHFEVIAPRRWRVRVDLDGTPVLTGDDVPQFAHFLPYEGIDVGIDRRSPVSWDLYRRHGAFPFTGTIHDVTYTPGPADPDADRQRLEDLLAIGTALE